MVHNSYCAQQVKRGNFDQYLSCLFVAEPQRTHLFALQAFNLEIAKTANVVSEPMIGEIRLQWWQDTIDEIFAGSVKKHEVVEPLSEAIKAYTIPQTLFHELIAGRRQDLSGARLSDLDGLRSYASATFATFLRLEAMIAAPDLSQVSTLLPLEPAIEAAGLCLCALELLATEKYVPVSSPNGFAPVSMDKTISSQRETPEAKRSVKFSELAPETLRDVVLSNYQEVRAFVTQLPDDLLPVFLPLTLTKSYLKKTTKQGEGRGMTDIHPWAKQFLMLSRFVQKRI